MTQQPLQLATVRQLHTCGYTPPNHFEEAMYIAQTIGRRNKAAAVSEWAAEIRAGLAEKLKNGAR